MPTKWPAGGSGGVTAAELAAKTEELTQLLQVETELLYKPVFVVTAPMFGAIGDEVTDNTEAIQAAIDEASEAGGGIVYFPKGVYMSKTLKMKSNVILRGENRGSTWLKLIAGTTDLVSTLKVGEGGQARYTVREMTLDGNEANGGLGSCWNSDGTKVTGFELEIRNGKTNGLRHRQSGAQLSAAEGGDDSFFLWIWSFNNGENDILDEAHDTSFTHCRCVGKAKNGFKNVGGGTQATLYDVHVWSKSERHELCFNFESTWEATNCTAEGASVGQVRVKSRGVWNGGRVFSVTGAENTPGFLLVESSSRLITRAVEIENTGTGGAFKAIGASSGSGSDLDFLVDGSAWETTVFVKEAGGSFSEGIKVRPNCRGTFKMGEPPTMVSVASANEITLGTARSSFKLTGTAEVKKIKATYAEHEVTLITTSEAKLIDGENLKLKEAFNGTADDTITLVCDGTNWFEKGRSVN